MKTTPVTFKVISLDNNFSYMGNTSYQNPDKVAIPASYEVLNNTYSWRKKGLKVHSNDTEPISVVAWSFSGTKIISDSPFTIISGHETAQVPSGTYDADTIVTQLTPTITWGKSFIILSHMGQSNRQNYKVIAANIYTNAIKTCGTNYPNIRLKFDENNTNSFYTTNNLNCSIISDQPIYVAQIGNGQRYGGAKFSGPSLNTVPPIEQYEHSIQFSTLMSNGTSYYSVVVPNDAYFNQSLLINNVLTNPPWVLIYDYHHSILGYGYSTLFNGTNTIAHPNPKGKLFVSIYG